MACVPLEGRDDELRRTVDDLRELAVGGFHVATSWRMDVWWPFLGARLTGLPVGQADGWWPRRRVDAGLIGLAGTAGFLHGVVDLEDDTLGSVVAVKFLLILAPDDGEGEPRGQTDLEFLVEKILNRSGLAPRSSGEEDSRSLKPFRWNPAGNQSRPVEPDQQPEASLAWWVGDHPCEA